MSNPSQSSQNVSIIFHVPIRYNRLYEAFLD